MLDPSNFDKAVKAAEKLETILRRSKNLAALSGIEVGLRSLTLATDQTTRLLQRTKLLSRESADLAYRQAGITKETYRRVKFYDQELAAVRRNRVELQSAARAESARFETRKRGQLNANAAAQAGITAELSRRSQLMTDLGAEYNLRASMSGFDVKAAEVANELASNNARVLELQTKLKTVESNRLDIEKSRSQKLQQITGKLEEQNAIEKSTNALKAADKVQQKAVQKENFKDFISDKFAGGLIGQFKQLTGALSGLGVALGVFAVFALLLKAVVGAYRDGLKATIDLGLDASQRTREVLQGQKIVAQAAAKGALISIEDAVKAKGALSEVFGTLDIPNEVILKSAELTRQLGLSNDEAASLFDFFGRIRGEGGAAAALSAVVLKATALSNRANPAQVMRDVATNAANFAKSGRAGADELARAAILTRRMGVDLSTIAGIADNIVTNFEGSLEAQASIGAFAPGFDQTGLLVASQFGTDEDIARELKSAVDSLGTDFDSLPRSFKLSIASGLGVSVEQLAKIAKNTGDAMDVVSPDAQAMITAEQNATNELQKAIVNPLDSIEKGIFSILSFMVGRFSKGDAAQKAKGLDSETLSKNAAGGQSLIDKITGTGDSNAAIKEIERRTLENQIQDLSQVQAKTPEQKERIKNLTADAQNRLNALNAESRAIGGTVGVDKAPSSPLSLMSMFKKLGSNEVPTILHKGEAVLNQSQMGMLGQLTGAQSGIAKSMTGFVSNFTDKFAGKDGILGKVSNLFGGGKSGGSSGGILGSITKSLGGTGSGGLMSKITGSSNGGGLMSKIAGTIGGSGGIMGKISGLFGGGDKKAGGGIMGAVSGLIGGKSGGIMGKITGALGGGSSGGGIMGKVSGLIGGNLKDKAAGILGKIPGIGGLAGNLLKGGGIKGIGGSLLKAGAGKLIGGAIGSIIPGAGTIVGSLIGSVVGKGIGKLANTRVGKAVTGFIGKSPIGKIGGKVLGTAGKLVGGIGKKLGGLFGRKKKPAPVPVQPDYSQMAGMSGMMAYGGSLTSNGYQSGINFGGSQPQYMGQSPMMPQMGMGNTQALEAKFDTLISLLKSGAIGVNIDGKKVSESLVDANRYG